MKKNIIYILLAFLPIMACAEKETPVEPEEKKVKVNCTTGEATDIDPTSAKLNGSANIENATEANGVAYFYYSSEQTDAKGLAKSGSRVSAGSISNSDSAFSETITNLTPETKYYYLASVSIDEKEFNGEVKSFTTAEKPKELSVTGAATDITEFKAKLSGYANLTPDLGNVTMGILYSKEENPSLENSVELTSREIDGNNMYTVQAKDLEYNTVYYYKSFVQYGGVYRFGAVKTFTTRDFAVTVKVAPATEISETKATLNGSLEVDSIEDLSSSVWFYYGTMSKPEELKTKGEKIVASEKDGQYSCNQTGLVPETTYYYLVGAKVHDKEVYSEVMSYKTADYRVIVATEVASGVGLFSATISGKLIVESRESLSHSVWFLYGTSANNLEALKESGTKFEATINSDGVFSYALSSLDYNTTYYYVACAKVHDREYYGEVKSFSTTNFGASVTSEAATDLGLFAATINGKLTVENGESLFRSAWFLYSSSANNLEALKESGIKSEATINSDGAFSYALSSLDYNTTYYYVACAKVHDREYYGEVKSFITMQMELEEITDLGLSVKWRGWNLGANSPKEYGDYYSWGETEPKSDYSMTTYKWWDSSNKTFTKYNINSKYGPIDNKMVLEEDDDVAHVKLGGKWRMPTDTEWTELKDNCTWIWITNNGIKGSLIISKKNGKGIFLPAAGNCFSTAIGVSVGGAGDYWSASLYTDANDVYNDSYDACFVRFTSNGIDAGLNKCTRSYGCSVRPVIE
ncbi:MAG: hypothetical protein IKN31_08845 [Bacteroidales bacterium]|nr:hypothetical protein [Bacteroidales bacterium]